MMLCYLVGQGADGSPNLKDVMVFLTGCESTPPLGWGDVEQSIKFLSPDGENVLPTVSTCLLILKFPLNFPTDFNVFKDKMDLAILGSQGFFGSV